jgi:hypothetical protein
MNDRSFFITIPLLLLVGLVAWVYENDTYESFTMPSEGNLQTLILHDFDESLNIDTKITEEEITYKTSGTIDRTDLYKISKSLLQNWDYTPPISVTDGTNHYQLSDVFGSLANTLRFYNQNHYLPQEVELIHLIPPAQKIKFDHDIEIAFDEIINEVNEIELNEKEGIPSIIHLENTSITSTQFLYAMTQAYLMIENSTEETYLYVIPTKAIE